MAAAISPLPPIHLTPAQRGAFERDGYLFPLRALDGAQVAHYRGEYDAYAARHRDRLASLKPRERYQVFAELHYAYRWAYELVTHPRVLDAVESILGPNILSWDTSFFSKNPGDPTYVSWHQDGTYWKLNGPAVVTAWIALSPSNPTTGCMRVVPGTQKTQFLPQRETFKDDNALSRGQEIAVEVSEGHAVDLTLAPGEFSLHHLWIVHGSNANLSPDTPRIGMACRYIAPEVSQDSLGKPFAILVRGRDTTGNFQLFDPPPPDDGTDRAALHTDVMTRIRENLMQGVKK